MAMAGNEELTPREGEVLELLALRLTNREIAERLTIEERTVETHVASILHKLGCKSRHELWVEPLH